MSTATLHSEKIKALIPQLRFSEFEGEWEMKNLGDIFKITAGGDIRTENVSQVKTEKFKYPIYANAEKNKGFYGYSDIFKIEENVLTVAGRGVNIGIAHARNHKFYPIVRLLVLRAKNKEDIYFFEYQINRLNLFKESTGVPQLTAPQVSGYEIFYPQILEQQKIASFLSAVDEKIQQLSRKKELLEKYKKGVMQQLFSGKLRFKDENGKDYPDWEEKKLGEVLKIGSGKDYKHLGKGNIPVFGTGGYMLSVNKFLHCGETVFIGRKGTIDKPFYFNGEFWTVDTLFYTHTFKNTIPKFIYCVFQQINWKLHNEASGVPSLSKSTIEKLNFNFPCIQEQQKIANFLWSIDTKIESVNQQLAQTQTFKKGLLQQMFV